MASLVKLRVVHSQSDDVQPIRGSNILTCIIGVDNVSGRAVLVNKTKADGIAHLEVVAILVNKTRVGHTKLVTTVEQPKMLTTGKSV
jgi:hypothetical protein